MLQKKRRRMGITGTRQRRALSLEGKAIEKALLAEGLFFKGNQAGTDNTLRKAAFIAF